MDDDKFDKLKQKYPRIYGNLRGDAFECGEGWYDILDDIGEKIEERLKPHIDEDADQQWPVIVKQKFGSLRIQWGGAFHDKLPKRARKALNKYTKEAYERSVEVCERCGAPGDRENKPFPSVLCEECKKE